MPRPRDSGMSQRAREDEMLASEDEWDSEDETQLDRVRKQSPETKRRIRAKYRQMQAQADELRDSVNHVKLPQLQDIVAQTNVMFKENVFSAGEATLDSRLFFTHTDTAARLADLMKTSANSFDMDEFMIRAQQKLGLDREAMDDDEEAGRGGRRNLHGAFGDWESLGWLGARYGRRSTGVEFMNGPLLVGYKKRVVAKRAKRQPDAPITRPEEVAASEKDAENSTVATTKEIFRLLKKLAHDSGDPVNFSINLFEFVVNPTSYCQTVENLFFLSFLVRDGFVVIEWDKAVGLHVIRLPQEGDGKGDHNQEVFSLTMDVVNEAIELFDIRESIIPDRPVPEAHKITTAFA